MRQASQDSTTPIRLLQEQRPQVGHRDGDILAAVATAGRRHADRHRVAPCSAFFRGPILISIYCSLLGLLGDH